MITSRFAVLVLFIAQVMYLASQVKSQNTVCPSTVPVVTIQRNTSTFNFAANLQEPSTSTVQVNFEYGTNAPGCSFTGTYNACSHSLNLVLTPYQFVTCGIARNQTETAIVFTGAVLVSVTSTDAFERIFRYPFRISFRTQVTLVQSFNVQSGARLAASLRLQKQYFDVTKRAGIIQGLINYSSDFNLLSYNASASNAAELNLINNGVTCADPTCGMQFTLEAYIAIFECTFSGVYKMSIDANNIDVGIQGANFTFNIASEDVCGIIEIESDPVPSMKIFNSNLVEASTFLDNERITFELNVASDFPLQSTRMRSLMICAVPVGLNASSCTDVNAVAISSAIQDYIAFPGVTVTLPSANQARASLIMSRSALAPIRPLANNQFFVQTTASITYSGNLEISKQVQRFARLAQSGRNYENAVGKRFQLTELEEASNNSNLLFHPLFSVVVMSCISLLLL